MTAALMIRDVVKRFGNSTIIRGLSLEVSRGERHAIIGPNGAGKSTMINLISGQFPPNSGSIMLSGRAVTGQPPSEINRAGLGRSFQTTSAFAGLSVFDNIRLGVLGRCGHRLTAWLPVSRLSAVTRETNRLVEEVNLTEFQHARADQLSYAQQRALEIGLTLSTLPTVLLLDEPTAGMSREEVAHFTKLLSRVSEGRTLLVVEHDMEVVFTLADRISVLVHGQIMRTGTPEQIRSDPEVQAAYLGERPQ